jgi:predicted Zn finger-like uncharacterized protein
LAVVEITCPHCNYTKSIPLERIPPVTRWVRCPRCRNRFEYLGKGEDPQTEKRQATPWETRVQVGLWPGIKQTVKSVILSPRSMFSTMAISGGWREPLAFGLLVGSISSMVSSFWDFTIATSGLFKPLWGGWTALRSPVIFLSFMFLSPLLVAIDLFISSLLIHALLLLVRGGRNGFEATFRVVAYSQATKLWSIMPFIGSAIAWVWRIIVQIVGLKEAHEIGYVRIIVAFLIPVIMLLIVISGVFLLLVRS